MTQKWTQQQAVDLCRKIEAVCPEFGCHVALTGGLLYKDGERKDADILFYRIRQVDEIDVDGLMSAMEDIGVSPGRDFGWCHKATYAGRPIDFFFPDRVVDDDDYPPHTEPDPDQARQERIDREMEEEIVF